MAHGLLMAMSVALFARPAACILLSSAAGTRAAFAPAPPLRGKHVSPLLASHRCPAARALCSAPQAMAPGQWPGRRSFSNSVKDSLGVCALGFSLQGAAGSIVLHAAGSGGRRAFSDGPERGGGRNARRRGAWRQEMSPSEMRVLQKQRREGKISGVDLARLSRAERWEREERMGGGGRMNRGVQGPAEASSRRNFHGNSGGNSGGKTSPRRDFDGDAGDTVRRRGSGDDKYIHPGQSSEWRMKEMGAQGGGREIERKRVAGGGWGMADDIQKRLDAYRNSAGRVPAMPAGARGQGDEKGTQGGGREAGEELSARRQRRRDWNARQIESDASGAWRQPRRTPPRERYDGSRRDEPGSAWEDRQRFDMNQWRAERGLLHADSADQGASNEWRDSRQPLAQGRSKRWSENRGSRWRDNRGYETQQKEREETEDHDWQDGYSGKARGRLASLGPVPQAVQVDGDAPKADIEKFAGVACSGRMADALRLSNISQASPIQAEGIPVMMTGVNTILHSPTGSGKTLAFLVPVLARIQASQRRTRDETRGAESEGAVTAGQVLVMVPSRELALQVAAEALKLGLGQGGEGGDGVHLIVGGTQSPEMQARQWRSSCAPLVVATPDRLLKVLQERDGQASEVLANLQVVVLDEVDRMLDSLGKYATSREVARRRRHPKKVVSVLEMIAEHHNERNLALQLVACSATVGRSIRRDLARIDDSWSMGSFEIVRASAQDYLSDDHRRLVKSARFADRNNGPVAAGSLVPPTITHQFVAVRKDEDKYAMLQYLLTSVCSDQPALVFLRDDLSVRDMVQKMKYSGIPRAVALHEALGFASFDAANATESVEKESGGGPKASMESLLRHRQALQASLFSASCPPLVVMNEASARGIDLKINVVFLWDLPKETASYLHMAGRTGRAGQEGMVVTLATKYDRARLSLFQSHLGIKFKYLEDFGALRAGEHSGQLGAQDSFEDLEEKDTVDSLEEDERDRN